MYSSSMSNLGSNIKPKCTSSSRYNLSLNRPSRARCKLTKMLWPCSSSRMLSSPLHLSLWRRRINLHIKCKVIRLHQPCLQQRQISSLLYLPWDHERTMRNSSSLTQMCTRLLCLTSSFHLVSSWSQKPKLRSIWCIYRRGKNVSNEK